VGRRGRTPRRALLIRPLRHRCFFFKLIVIIEEQQAEIAKAIAQLKEKGI